MSTHRLTRERIVDTAIRAAQRSGDASGQAPTTSRRPWASVPATCTTTSPTRRRSSGRSTNGRSPTTTISSARSQADARPRHDARPVHGIFAHQWRYRFLQREFPALIRQDEQLRARYREMQDRRIGFYRFLGRHWIETEPPADVRGGPGRPGHRHLALGDTWLSYLESMGRGDDEDEIRRGSRLIYALLRPHLTSIGCRGVRGEGWGSPAPSRAGQEPLTPASARRQSRGNGGRGCPRHENTISMPAGDTHGFPVPAWAVGGALLSFILSQRLHDGGRGVGDGSRGQRRHGRSAWPSTGSAFIFDSRRTARSLRR